MCKENDIKTAERAIKLCKKAGISITALLITGNVGEKEESIKDTIKFLRRINPDDIGCVGGLWILPGTKLYQQCKRKGFINDEFWLTDESYKIYTLEYSVEELAIMQEMVLNYHSIATSITNKIRKLIQ
jgi:coproporphyrinogen III oxidase-like Fe-S oxidoreductase